MRRGETNPTPWIGPAGSMDSTQLWTYLVWVVCGIVALLAVAFLVRVVHRSWVSAEEDAQRISQDARRALIQGVAATDCFGTGRSGLMGPRTGETRRPGSSEGAGQ